MADESIQRWNGRAGVARLIRIAIVVVPFSASVAMAFALSNRLPIAESMAGRGLRLLVILIAATATMMLVDRLARRLLPLSALFHLTLIFPDQAPSRFKIALKTSSAVDLEERIAAAMHAPEGETRGEAAERLLELVGLLSHHDQITRGHSERVRAYTQILGEEMGLTETELDKIRWAGLLHDVGKTTIPAEILNKPGKLTDDEFDIIKGHPEAGRRLVEPLEDWLGDSLRAVWEHHERWDGTGYPRRLSGTNISLGARIVSVADTYDVITSARSYKRPLSAVEARAELARCAGEQFDPAVVRAFLNISLGKLRWMAGPSAWVAQLALFEPTGVVHAGDGGSGALGAAGSSGAGSSTAGAATVSASASGTTAAAGSTVVAGATTASTTATALTSAAAVGSSSSVVGTLAVVGVGVAAGTTGVVAADGPLPSETAVETAFVEDAGPVAAVDEPIVLDEAFAPRVTLVRESAAESDVDEDGLTGVFAPTESVDVPAAAPATASDGDLPEAGVAIASDDEPGSDDGADPAGSGDEDAASPPENDQPQVGGSVEPDSSDDDSAGPSTPTGATTTTTTVPASGGSGGDSGSTATTVPTTVPPVVTVPTNPTVPTTVPVTVPTTTLPAVTTVPPTTVPPTTVPPAPTTTLPPPPVGSLDPAATTFFLEAGSSWSPWWGTLGDVVPADVPLVDLDPWGDGDAGLTLPKTSAGVSSLIPGHVAVFRSSVDADMVLERIESLELFVAANDFDREDVHVEASLRRCTGWLCTTLASADDEVRNADDFERLQLFTDVDLDAAFEAGDVIELRIAVLDDSEAWGMLAFGTDAYDSSLELKIDDTP